MTTEDQELEQTQEQQDPAQPPATKGDDGEKKGPPKTVPYERFAEVARERKELRERLQAIEAKLKTDEERQLEEERKWQELAERRQQELQEAQSTMQQATEELSVYKEAIEAQLAALKKDVPDHILALLEKLSPPEQLKYLAENKSAIAKQTGGGTPPTPKRAAQRSNVPPRRTPLTL